MSQSSLILTAGFPCQDLSTAGRKKGLHGSRSGLWKEVLYGLSLRMSIKHGNSGCPNCGANSTKSGIPVCQFMCAPVTLDYPTVDQESSLLPTPTATNYGYCIGGANGRVGKKRPSLQTLGIQHPEDWERLMGYPVGWTDLNV